VNARKHRNGIMQVISKKSSAKEILLKGSRCLEKIIGRRLACIRKEALEHNGLKNAVRTDIEMAQK